jgi:O-antigen/teichoic acid export membrane protein
MNVMGKLSARIRWIGAAETPASAVVHALASRILLLCVNVTTGIIVARTLGPEGRGTVAAIFLWMFVIPRLLTLGVPAALRYQVRRRTFEAAELFSSALIISAILGFLSFVIGIVIVPHLLTQYSRSVVAFAQVMMIFAPFALCNATVEAFFESEGAFKQANAMIYLPPVGALMGLLILLETNNISPYTVAIVYELPLGLIAVATIIQVRRSLRLPQDVTRRVRSLLHYGLRAYGIDVLETLASQIDQALVVGLLSAASFGIYAVAVNASFIVSLPGMSLNAVLSPTASGLDRTLAVALVSRSARLVFACTLLGGIAFALVLPIVVPLAYGDAYLPVIRLTQLLTIGVLFGITSTTFSQAFMATGRPEITTTLLFIRLCLTASFMLALIPRFGLTGAVYAIDIASALQFALVMLSYPLVLRLGLPRLLPTERDIRDLVERLRHATVS